MSIDLASDPTDAPLDSPDVFERNYTAVELQNPISVSRKRGDKVAPAGWYVVESSIYSENVCGPFASPKEAKSWVKTNITLLQDSD